MPLSNFFHPAARRPRARRHFPTRRSSDLGRAAGSGVGDAARAAVQPLARIASSNVTAAGLRMSVSTRSEEHTSELQSPYDPVCRLRLVKKKHELPTLRLFEINNSPRISEK